MGRVEANQSRLLREHVFIYAMPRQYWIVVQDQRVTEDGVHYFLLSFSPKLWLQL